MLRKEHLRVSRAGGGYHLQFAGREHRPLAARVIGTFQGHVGQPRERLEEALAEREAGAEDFKLVRGLAALLERECTFETRAPIDPERARRVAFEEAEVVGVASDRERDEALSRAGERLRADPDEVSESLYADLEGRQVLTEIGDRYDPDSLLAQYDLSLAQTALFDATEVRVRSSDPRTLVSAAKRLGLLYEVERTPDGRELVLTGPDTVFGATRRYGTRFARLLRSVASTEKWSLTATVDDYGTERTLELSEEDLRVPEAEPVTEVSYDSAVEAEFATRFSALDLDWELIREPEPLETGASVMIPDFAFDYRFSSLRVFFEIMGFWTPEYVEKKLGQLEDVEEVDLIVAYDASLGVGDELGERDVRAIPYTGRIRVKDVRDALRTYERDLEAESAAALPESLAPEEDVLPIADLADSLGVSERALSPVSFPEHECVGRTLVRPAVLDRIDAEIEGGESLSAVEEVLKSHDVSETSAVLSRLGYRIAWQGLGSGTLEPVE
ncbi:DUF790 family protein [Natronorarus salvus]|uniref:DUF790 family protein n=1 Tax=Natronorarus salvus TaxID=3117733 RepID=UPI002F261D0F